MCILRRPHTKTLDECKRLQIALGKIPEECQHFAGQLNKPSAVNPYEGMKSGEAARARIAAEQGLESRAQLQRRATRSTKGSM